MKRAVWKIFILTAFLMQLFCPSFANDFNFFSDDNEIIFSQKVYPLNAIDPTTASNIIGSFYPGLRGANQMIVYTSAFGFRTGTNEFGSEAIVSKNITTALSGADSLIPRDGFVVSGHGSVKKWINENIILGSKVYVNPADKTLTVYITSDSFLYGAQQKIKEANEIVNYYKERSLDYDSKKSKSYIALAQDYLDKAKHDPSNVQRYSSQAIESANLALANALPYIADELKGVWIRPTETSAEEIVKTLDRLKSAGINNIFLETYFHGKTIFPSKTMASYNFIMQNEKFAGFDPLKIWVQEAHKRKIKVNIWFETFYVGNESPQLNSQSILAVKPEWANKTKKDYDKKEPTPSLSEHNGYFLDPANPEVQNFLEYLIKEIITTYSPDGINLDYIRYPQSLAAKYPGYDLSNWGYTEFARNDFKLKYCKDPLEILPNDKLWQDWDNYRQNNITSFVGRINNMARNKKILLTAVIFPDRQKALETKQQDWKTWSERGYIDGFTPLLLTCDAKTANMMIQDINKHKHNCTHIYSGLFVTFMGGSGEDLIRQIHEARKLNSKGIIIFDYAHLDDKYKNTLMASVFSPAESSCYKIPADSRYKIQRKKRTPFKLRKII